MTMTTDIPLVCTPEEFMAASYHERRKLVVTQIDLTPHLWDQRWWTMQSACGTVHCAGGWACVLAGPFKPSCVGVVNAAAMLLGLTDEQAGCFFAGYNTRDRLGELVDEWADM